MFLGHDLGRVLNSYHETGRRFWDAEDVEHTAQDEAEELSLRALLIRLAIITGLMAATIIMLALFVGTFTHYY